MVRQAGLGGDAGISSTTSSSSAQHEFGAGLAQGLGGEQSGRRGGLGVWYDTRGEGNVRGEETDFIATLAPETTAAPPPSASLLQHMCRLVYALPTDTLRDTVGAKGALAVRPALLGLSRCVRTHTTYRDAHVYLLPRWVVDWVARRPEFDSVSEDVVGWWARAGWQHGLAVRLGLADVLAPSAATTAAAAAGDEEATGHDGSFLDESVALTSLTTTGQGAGNSSSAPPGVLPLIPPPILAYVQPGPAQAAPAAAAAPPPPMIRRVDTGPLLLAVSLRLAKLPAADEVGASAALSPFAHKRKIADPELVAQRSTVTRADCLLDGNVTVDEKAVVKECVIGANCRIGGGARLTRCLLMEGAVVGERAQLHGCVLGRRCRIGREAVLRDCEVQGGYQVPDEGTYKAL